MKCYQPDCQGKMIPHEPPAGDMVACSCDKCGASMMCPTKDVPKYVPPKD